MRGARSGNWDTIITHRSSLGSPPYGSKSSRLWIGLISFFRRFNVIIGFVAIWFLVKMFLSERHALIAVVLLELVPFYTFLSFKFNANAILLSLWPLTALFFCHAYATRRFTPSLLFGVVAALALLSKYYSFCLLAALFLISILCKERRQYYTSVSPYISVLALVVVLAPHLYWLFNVAFLPIHYAASHIIHDPFRIMTRTGTFAAAQLLYLLPMALAFVAIVGVRAIRRPQQLSLKDSKRITVFGITFFPFLLTIGGALVLQVELSSVWGLPIWFLIGASYLTFLGLEPVTNHVRRGWAIVFAFQLLILSASPLVAVGHGGVKERGLDLPTEGAGSLYIGHVASAVWYAAEDCRWFENPMPTVSHFIRPIIHLFSLILIFEPVPGFRQSVCAQKALPSCVCRWISVVLRKVMNSFVHAASG